MIDKEMLTSANREAVRQEASKILNHVSFRTSERCTKLFRYLVEESLTENAPPIKERRVGHEVFGREPGYDTAADPIVRNVASEIRKRLRQYYHEADTVQEVHIELVPGSYLLGFQFVESQAVLPSDSVSALPSAPSGAGKARKMAWWPHGAMVLGLVVCAMAAFAWHLSQSSNSEKADGPAATSFWQPMFASKKEIFISLGHGLRSADTETQTGGLQRITMTDLKAYANISGLLELNGHPFQMRPDTMTKMADLKDRPVVLIGNVNNEWVLRLTPNLRFRYEFDRENKKVVIHDSMHPKGAVWEVRYGKDAPPLQVDYALADRFKDPITGSMVVCVAGAGAVGTEAASVFITQKKYLDTLPKSLSNPDTNIQVLLKTNIVDGVPGPPEVITTYIW